jgi:hypothetical protein
MGRVILQPLAGRLTRAHEPPKNSRSPVVYNNNRRAILAVEKGAPGERVFARAFEVWKQ